MKAIYKFMVAVFLLPSLVHAVEIREIVLATNDIIYDPFTQKIYASVPSSAGLRGNAITSIDPRIGAIGPSVFIGSEPGKLAISDDGQFLYVALDGTATVRRFDIVSQTPGLQFPLGGESFYGPYMLRTLRFSRAIPGRLLYPGRT